MSRRAGDDVKRILLVDDDVAVTNHFLVALTQTGAFEPVIVNDSRRVPDLLAAERFDAIVLDLDMPDVSGVDILKLLQEKGIRTPVVVLTGVGDLDLAVKSMKLGAFDYLTKPVDDEHLMEALEEAVEHGALHRTLSELPAELRREDLAHGAAFEGFITRDPKMVRVLHEAEKMAAGAITVLILGERGTGREALARAMHGISRRREGPFVIADALGDAREVFPAMLFGQARVWRGAAEERGGLLEQAAGGTLFIDHLGLLALPVQMRLRRVIQSGKYYRENSTHVMLADARLIVASTEDLASPQYKGPLSPDLLCHLTVNTLRLPPLRDRRGDIALVAEHVIRLEAARAGKSIVGLAPDAAEFLDSYPFPGNDRELESVIASAMLRCEGEQITLKDLPPCVREPPGFPEEPAAEEFEPKRLAEIERDYVVRTLKFCDGDKAQAAARLGITSRQLERLLAPGKGQG